MILKNILLHDESATLGDVIVDVLGETRNGLV